jgi:probable rRNA maturation factor
MEAGTGSISVTVLNETTDDIDVVKWADLVERVLTAEGVAPPAETNIVFVDVEAMTELNVEHMGGDGPTDVLSFPIDDDPEFAAFEGDDDVRFVGDIVVCGPVAAANAPTHAGEVDDEIALLLVHGCLHLLGHDHAEADDRDVMWAAEQRLLAQFWRPLSRDPWEAS